MSEADAFRHKAEALLKKATEARSMADRGRLLDEALHWHELAMDAAGHPDQRLHDNDEDEDEEDDEDDLADCARRA